MTVVGDSAAEGAAEDAVRSLVLDMYGALSRGDAGWFAEHAETEDVVHVGVAESFWITGDVLVEQLGPSLAAETMTWSARDLVVGVWGDTAVVVDRPHVGFDDGSALDCRATTVFARTAANGPWRLVHTHVSLGED